jgi:ribosomal protein L37E
MAIERNELAVIEVPPPRAHRGHHHCPRCDGRVLYDRVAFLCLSCGYEYKPNERELARYLAA